MLEIDSERGIGGNMNRINREIDPKRDRFPFCIVWTPIPVLTWLFPIIGHMGIAYSSGVIRDFAGHYFVSEDNMAFGKPTKYWQLRPENVNGGAHAFDRGITEASEIYKTRMHNLCCDNCHSHVAKALNLMEYKNHKCWNMVSLAFLMIIFSKYVNFCGFIKTWLPFLIIVSISVSVYFIIGSNK